MEKDKLIRFLNGECNPEEEQEIWLWVESPAARKELDLLIEQTWEKPNPDMSDQTDYVELLSQIHSRFQKNKKRRIYRWNAWFKKSLQLAASLSIVVFCVYFLLAGFKYDANNSGNNQVTSIRTTTRTTGPGEKLTLTMPDGTTIILNALSEISFSSIYGQKERVVRLKGEAYFEIASDSLRPFSVQTNGLTTTALGTQFNVFARAHHYKIALAEGAVKIDAMDRELKLVPGQLAVWKPTPSHAEFSVGSYDAEEILGWKEGTLKFNRKPLKIILKELAAWYGVDIQIEEGVNTEKKVIGSFQNKNLENILTGLGFTTGFNFKINGENVQITKESL